MPASQSLIARRPKGVWNDFRTRIFVLALGMLLAMALTIAVGARIFHRPTAPVNIAIVMPLTGAQAREGHSIVEAVQLCFNKVNATGGIGGHPLQLIAYDDEGRPSMAVQRAKEIAASNALAVIGHFTSATSVPAGPIYKAAHMPAVTASSNAPAVTANNPYYFRVASETSSQGHLLAAYAVKVLGKRQANVLYTDEEYGRSIRAAFEDEFADQGGNITAEWAWNPEASEKERLAFMQRVSDDLANGDGEILILAMSPFSSAREAVALLRRAGVNPVMLGGTAMGNSFPQLFSREPEEQREPGFFTNNLYIASPIIYDSAGERAVIFNNEFRKTYGEQADERAANHYEAAELLALGLRESVAGGTGHTLNDHRERLRTFLARQNVAAQAMPGLTGPIYFDSTQSLSQPVRIGRCVEGHFISAPVQLEAIPNPALIDLDGELAASHVIRIRQTFYYLQRVVYTGIDINQISRIDMSKGTFTADFYLWFRYAGDNSVRDIDLNSATEKAPYDPKAPLLEQQVNGLHYALYRIRGDFRAAFDFHDYPFDSQSLTLQLSNPRRTREQTIYAVDSFGLRLFSRNYEDVTHLKPLSNWNFTNVRYESDTLTSDSTRGQPGAFHSNYETEFSGFNTVIGIKRKALVFLIKNLLPLLLLVVVVYVTLYFPPSLSKERLTIAISAMLASAVLLISLNNQLTDVGYTTAIEYGFYVFFCLCIYCVIAGLMAERFQQQKKNRLADRFNVAVRVTYPLIVMGVFLWYRVRYR
jgi:branched-chain amino acid transport system substrate-binding protein